MALLQQTKQLRNNFKASSGSLTSETRVSVSCYNILFYFGNNHRVWDCVWYSWLSRPRSGCVACRLAGSVHRSPCVQYTDSRFTPWHSSLPGLGLLGLPFQQHCPCRIPALPDISDGPDRHTVLVGERGGGVLSHDGGGILRNIMFHIDVTVYGRFSFIFLFYVMFFVSFWICAYQCT